MAASAIFWLTTVPLHSFAWMERPLEDATTANLWKTLFALIVELSLRSGLVTEEELVPALTTLTNEGTRLGTDSQADGPQEQQEDGRWRWAGKEEDPIVEVAQEPDAETEPSMNTEERVTSEGTAPSASAQECSMMANDGAESGLQIHSSLLEGLQAPSYQATSQHSYPPEYDPFDRPVGEVVAQLFDDSQPVNPLPPNDNGREWDSLSPPPLNNTIHSFRYCAVPFTFAVASAAYLFRKNSLRERPL